MTGRGSNGKDLGADAETACFALFWVPASAGMTRDVRGMTWLCSGNDAGESRE